MVRCPHRNKESLTWLTFPISTIRTSTTMVRSPHARPRKIVRLSPASLAAALASTNGFASIRRKLIALPVVVAASSTRTHTSGALLTIAKNPVEAAKAYGKLTGSCSCCGRELSDPVSIEAGIGPVCATKWFGFAMPGPTKAEVKQALEEAAVEINTNYTKAKVSSVAGKYDHLYKEGMTAKEKQRIRAQARKEART